jgi:hypothetical protein
MGVELNLNLKKNNSFNSKPLNGPKYYYSIYIFFIEGNK